MLSFHQIVLRKFLVVFSVLFFIVGGIVYYWTKDFYIEQTKESLLHNVEILSYNLEHLEDLEKSAQLIKTNLQLRVTIIDQDGKVIIESHKNKEKMDNHRYREEIMQSDKEAYGFKIRRSKTIKKDLLYIAKKFSVNDKNFYIRMSKELKNINETLVTLGINTFFALAIFFAFIITIAYKISQQLEHEIQKIGSFLSSLTKKEKPTYINSEYSQEFAKITKLLTKVSQILAKKDKRKSKFTSKLQEANKQKDDIISAISHEFKNPIAVINGYCQTLLDDQDINPSIRQKFLGKIHNNGLRLSSLIDTLRLSIKLDSGQQTMNFSTVCLNDIVTDCVETIKVNYPKREIVLEGDSKQKIKADPFLFGVVLCNLIENAFKYSEDEVIVRFDKDTISVIDSGIGISKKNLENITSKFFRVNSNSWNNSLGLGLFIVNNIISLHHFSLEIQSKENQGSTFTIKM